MRVNIHLLKYERKIPPQHLLRAIVSSKLLSLHRYMSRISMEDCRPRRPRKGQAHLPHPLTMAADFRFSTRLDVVQKTQPIEDTVHTIRAAFRSFTKSKWNTVSYLLAASCAWMLAANLFSKPQYGPMPDLIKVAGLAKSLEPAIYYSERGHAQIGELQETSVAVWDLCESVRNTNMTSAPIIVTQLDDLSDKPSRWTSRASSLA